MSKTIRVLICAAALLAEAQASPQVVRIVDEAGAPVTSARVEMNGALAVPGANGRWQLPGEPGLVAIHVTADGYYDVIHTLAADDAAVADIVLVERQPQRRLLLFAGDTMLARRYFEPRAGEPRLVREGHIAADGAALLAHIAPYVRLADFASLNLETQLADEEPAERLPKSVTFYSPTALAALLRDAGFDYVALGNNHTYDYGSEGLQSTLAALAEAGLAWSGAGLSEAAARQPFVGPAGETPAAYLSYVGWAGRFEPNQVAGPGKGGAALGTADVFAADLARIPAQPSVLQYHSGLEYVEAPPLAERTSLRSAIDAGIDVAIGHHAHVTQGFEVYGGKLISYSMGNFLFDQYHYATQLGMLLYVWMDGETFHRAEIVPMHINGYVPTPATGAMRYALLNRLARLSAPYGVCLRASGAHAVILPDGDASQCGTQALGDMVAASGTGPVSLAHLGLSPLRPVMGSSHRRYRVGVDILQRGDFSYVGRFGTSDRSWIENANVAIDTGNDARLRIDVPAGKETVRGGMRVFERVFRPSNPATLSGRVHIDGDVQVRVLLQRRRSDDGLGEALTSGPLTEIGEIGSTVAGWQSFAFDFDQPRVATRSVRLLIEARSTNGKGGRVLLDDLAWIEWHTPWLAAADDDPAFGSHVAFDTAMQP